MASCRICQKMTVLLLLLLLCLRDYNKHNNDLDTMELSKHVR